MFEWTNSIGVKWEKLFRDTIDSVSTNCQYFQEICWKKPNYCFRCVSIGSLSDLSSYQCAYISMAASIFAAYLFVLELNLKEWYCYWTLENVPPMRNLSNVCNTTIKRTHYAIKHRTHTHTTHWQWHHITTAFWNIRRNTHLPNDAHITHTFKVWKMQSQLSFFIWTMASSGWHIEIMHYEWEMSTPTWYGTIKASYHIRHMSRHEVGLYKT